VLHNKSFHWLLGTARSESDQLLALSSIQPLFWGRRTKNFDNAKKKFLFGVSVLVESESLIAILDQRSSLLANGRHRGSLASDYYLWSMINPVDHVIDPVDHMTSLVDHMIRLVDHMINLVDHKINLVEHMINLVDH